MIVNVPALTKEQAEKRAAELKAKGEIGKIYARKGSGALFQIKMIDPMLKPDTKDEWEVIISAKQLGASPLINSHTPSEERMFYGIHVPTKN